MPRPGSVQGNPKLHKAGVPLRTIVSGRGHATERVAQLAESELRTHVESQSSYVRDTTDFIQKIAKTRLPTDNQIDPILFCMDVGKLYPSVPKREGLDACRKALDSREDPRIPTSEVMKIIQLVLENNNFSLGQADHYVQTNGTAIGSKLGRNYACTYLGSWEQELFSRCELKPFVYLRFIDDIFGCWLFGEEKLKEFHMSANSIHDKIKWT